VIDHSQIVEPRPHEPGFFVAGVPGWIRQRFVLLADLCDVLGLTHELISVGILEAISFPRQKTKVQIIIPT